MSDSLMGGAAEPIVNTGAPATPPVEGTGTPEFTGPEWAKGLEVEPDLLQDPSLKAIKDVPSLLKSYVHAQRKMGADKVVIPNKNSTKEEWMQFYGKLGLPTEFEKYEVRLPENKVFGDDLVNKFKEMAYQNNLLPEQASALFSFLNDYTAEQAQALEQSQQTSVQEAIESLQQEWGEAFQQNVRKAKLAVLEFGGQDFQKYLDESGLGNDPQLVKAFAKIGESFFKEDKFNAESTPAYAMSPDQAQKRINEIQGDFNGPYYNSMHPDHNRTVQEVNKLFQMAYPTKK
jgi:hypothetical protein